MNRLPNEIPDALTLEEPPAFVPRMVMTPALEHVMRHVVRQWQHRDQFVGLIKYGIRPLDRLLFYGPPGNGKTMACEWICQKLGLQLMRVRCDQLHGQYLGVTVKAVANVVEWLNDRKEPALCLFDEVEHIFVDRRSAAADSSCGHEIGSALTVFMQALDRWKSPTLIVMCTNLYERLDAALLSRVELRLEFLPPTAEQSLEVIAYWRELLHAYGADEWGPNMVRAIEAGASPASFRELRASVATAARDWTARQIPD